MIGCKCPVCISTNPRNKRTRCGVVVKTPTGNILIDTPPELRLQLVREDIRVIHSVLYTHSHADHLFGLDDIRIFPHYLDQPVPIYCESSVETQIRQSFSYAFDPLTKQVPSGGLPQMVFRSIQLDPFQVLGLPVIPIRLEHGRYQVLGFRIGNLAYCTDVKVIPPESWPLLEGLDILILDALREKPHPTHMCIAESLEVVEKVRPKQTYFTHIAHHLDHDATMAQLPDGVALAYDGLSFPFA